jgi:hypothetical protein
VSPFRFAPRKRPDISFRTLLGITCPCTDPRRPLRVTLWFCAFYVAGSFLLDALLEDDEDEHEHSDGHHDGHESEAEGRITFIPLPFTEQKVYPPPYERGSPDWLVFKSISEDPKKIQKLKSMCCLRSRATVRPLCRSLNYMRTMLTSSLGDFTIITSQILTQPYPTGPNFAQTYGYPVRYQHHIKVQFPYRPPAEWSQKG